MSDIKEYSRDEPFTPGDFTCDSSLHEDQVVEQTTSWLTINPYMGCSMACAYCFRERWGAASTPEKDIDPLKAVQMLEQHRLFEPHKTPISINISSTDALLPDVKPSTYKCVRYLDEEGYRNILGITTKSEIKKKDIKFFKSLNSINIVILISYAEIPFKIEPVEIEHRIENLKKLNHASIPCIHYFRPIVKGWNDSKSKIRKVLRVGEKYASAIAIGGLRTSPKIRKVFERRNISVPDSESGFNCKEIDKDILCNIRNIYNKQDMNVPIYKHTSCAVSHVFDIPNYNALYKEPKQNCTESCPLQQRNICGANY